MPFEELNLSRVELVWIEYHVAESYGKHFSYSKPSIMQDLKKKDGGLMRHALVIHSVACIVVLIDFTQTSDSLYSVSWWDQKVLVPLSL
jgi:hypothetical protein